MTKIAAKDIDAFDSLRECLMRAVEAKPQEGQKDERYGTVEAIISNIVRHADNILDDKADNISAALSIVNNILDNTISLLEKSDLTVPSAFYDEMKEVAACYDPTMRFH